MSGPEIVLVCVNYHTARATIRLYESLRKMPLRASLHLVIVDNSIGDEDYATLQRTLEPSESALIKAPSNLGYFGAASWALAWVHSNKWDPQWFIVSNPDISFPSSDFVQRLSQISTTEADVIAPAIIIESTGVDQNPFLRFRMTRARLAMFRWMYSHYAVSVAYQCLAAFKRALSRFRPSHHPSGGAAPLEVYAPHGAFVIFGRRYLRQAHFRPPGFLFGEEIFVGEMCRRHGLRIVYRPDLRVMHRCHATTGLIKSRRMVSFLKDSFDALDAEFFAGDRS